MGLTTVKTYPSIRLRLKSQPRSRFNRHDAQVVAPKLSKPTYLVVNQTIKTMKGKGTRRSLRVISKCRQSKRGDSSLS